MLNILMRRGLDLGWLVVGLIDRFWSVDFFFAGLY